MRTENLGHQAREGDLVYVTRTREAEQRLDWGYPHLNLPQSLPLPIVRLGSLDPKCPTAQHGVAGRWWGSLRGDT